MLIKIVTICVASWFSFVKAPVCETSAGSVSKKYTSKYKHTVTPMVVGPPTIQASNKIIKLPTGWIITKKR